MLRYGCKDLQNLPMRGDKDDVEQGRPDERAPLLATFLGRSK